MVKMSSMPTAAKTWGTWTHTSLLWQKKPTSRWPGKKDFSPAVLLGSRRAEREVSAFLGCFCPAVEWWFWGCVKVLGTDPTQVLVLSAFPLVVIVILWTWTSPWGAGAPKTSFSFSEKWQKQMPWNFLCPCLPFRFFASPPGVTDSFSSLTMLAHHAFHRSRWSLAPFEGTRTLRTSWATKHLKWEFQNRGYV